MKILVILFSLLATPLFAQEIIINPTNTQLQWDHDRQHVTHFNLVIDGVITNLGLPEENEITFPALTPGEHVIIVQACNSDLEICVASDPFEIQVIVLTKPTNLRIRQ